MNDIFEDLIDESTSVASRYWNRKAIKSTGSQTPQRRATDRGCREPYESTEAEKHRLSVENIPALMDEMGLERIDVDGLTVEKDDCHASIPQDRKEEAFAWLRENGLDDIIKNDVTCSFGKGKTI